MDHYLESQTIFEICLIGINSKFNCNPIRNVISTFSAILQSRNKCNKHSHIGDKNCLGDEQNLPEYFLLARR